MSEPVVTQEQIAESDFEWLSDALKQSQICKAEANALEQFTIQKIAVKYKIDIQHGETLDVHTGKITRINFNPPAPPLTKDGISPLALVPDDKEKVPDTQSEESKSRPDVKSDKKV